MSSPSESWHLDGLSSRVTRTQEILGAVVERNPMTSLIVKQDVTVVVRSTSERTQDACCALLREELPEENLVVIKESPACNMVRRTFEVALEHQRPWALAVDADVLVCRGAIEDLLLAAAQYDNEFFVMSGNILDKLAGGPRHGGLRLFQTGLCEVALQFVPGETVVRPDSHVMHKMHAAGYKHVHVDVTVGLHDFEQSYRDLYRKGFKHANKYRPMRQLFERLWTRLATDDPDYHVALWGLRTGIVFDGSLVVDATRYQTEIDILLKAQGLCEKDPLPISAYDGDKVQDIVDQWVSPSEYFEFLELDRSRSYYSNLRRRISYEGWKQTGWVRFPFWAFGAVLKRSGTLLMKWAVKKSH